MSTFVLVPGFWLGGWAWRDVAAPLRAAGHTVYTPSLTGLGERVHLASPAVNLETHITDIVNLLHFEELHDVILLAHSGAMQAVTGAADRVPERIARLVYLDTGPLPNGMPQADFGPPEQRARDEQIVAEQGDGWRLPFPGLDTLSQQASLAGIDEVTRGRMRALAVPMPWSLATDTLHLTNPALATLPKIGILNSFTEADVRQMIAAGIPAFSLMAGPEWRFVELPTSHWAMFSAPAELAAILLDAAAGRV
ncbi:MAG TPA: alpha/beta hydrolase [Thermomicrobiales bacterium]|jgi:pimeloyl-ACP methyl ester carboxylesterase